LDGPGIKNSSRSAAAAARALNWQSSGLLSRFVYGFFFGLFFGFANLSCSWASPTCHGRSPLLGKAGRMG
jgi:hypothetical protein